MKDNGATPIELQSIIDAHDNAFVVIYTVALVQYNSPCLVILISHMSQSYNVKDFL